MPWNVDGDDSRIYVIKISWFYIWIYFVLDMEEEKKELASCLTVRRVGKAGSIKGDYVTYVKWVMQAFDH